MTAWKKAKAAALRIREDANKKRAIHEWALATVAAIKSKLSKQT